MRKARRGDTVAIEFIGTLDNGRIFEETTPEEPLRFTIGADQVFPDLEAAVVGMAPGEAKNVWIPASRAYGPRRPENNATLKRENLPSGTEPRVGQKVQVRLRGGDEALLRVVGVTEAEVTLDGNHPLAGMDLTFALRLASIA